MSKKVVKLTEADIKRHIDNAIAQQQKTTKNLSENMKNKKVVRLTESELKRYIQKIVAEQTAPTTGAAAGTATPTAKPAAPTVPVTGGSGTELQALRGKAVLVRDHNGGYYSCVITSAAHYKDNTVYLTVSCQNNPEFQWIRYKVHGDGHLYIGGSTKAGVELEDGELLKYLKKNVNPYSEKYDFTSKVNSPMGGGNVDFQS